MTDPAVYLYSVYGLTVESELPFPELPRGEGLSDVRIRSGPVPAQLDNHRREHAFFDVKPDEYLARLDEVAGGRFIAKAGRELVFELVDASDRDAMRALLLGGGMAALLHQRHAIPLHASSVATPTGAVLIAGDSGTGKSSLTRHLLSRGYPMLSDGLSPITFKGKSATVASGYPFIKLWEDMLIPAEAEDGSGTTQRKFQLHGEEVELARIRSDLAKYFVPIAPENFHPGALPLRAVFLLAEAPTDVLELTPVSGARKLPALLSQQYAAELMTLTEFHGPQWILQVAAALASVAVTSVKVPRSWRAKKKSPEEVNAQIAELADAIEQALGVTED